MGRSVRRRRHKVKPEKDSLKWSKRGPISVGILLINAFQWISLRGFDTIIVAFLSIILAAIGWVFGVYALRKIKRHRGVLQGEGAALMGYWGNLIVFLVSLLFFCWLLFLGIMRGEFI